MKHALAIAVCILLHLFNAAYAAHLVVSGNQDEVALGLYTDFYRDPSGQKTLSEVQIQGDFQRSDVAAPSFGFTQDHIWLRFTLENPTSETQIRILDVRYFLLDIVTLYMPNPRVGYSALPMGRFHMDNQRPEWGRFFATKLQLPPNSSQTFYLEVASGDSVALPVFLSTIPRQHAYQISDTFYMTLYGGLILATIAFALFMLVSLREKQLLYYLSFLISHHVFALMLMEGIPTAVLGMKSEFITRGIVPFTISFAILMSVLFMRDFLRLKQVNAALYRFTQWMAGAMLLSVLQSVLLPHYYALFITTVSCMIIGSCILACCFIQARNKHREAWHFLIAWSCGIVGATFYGLKVFTLLPVNLFTSYSWHAGTVLEAMMFSFTIAHRVNMERKQRLQVQTELTERERALRITQEKLLAAETAAKEELETKVRERTRDISRILVELEQENKVLVELSINDGLTRVRNRRFFNDMYPQMWFDSAEQKTWLSIVMVDIDHFKSINDQYGHLMGDRCLVVIANLLKQIVSRPTDMVCRYGGEEFILLLPNTDIDAARWVAERVRHRISETLCELDHSAITVTASLGVASAIPHAGQDPLTLINCADEALYRAKHEGRNRIVLAEKPAPASNVTPISRWAEGDGRPRNA